jgi:hypothetical protein
MKIIFIILIMNLDYIISWRKIYLMSLGIESL